MILLCLAITGAWDLITDGDLIMVSALTMVLVLIIGTHGATLLCEIVFGVKINFGTLTTMDTVGIIILITHTGITVFKTITTLAEIIDMEEERTLIL
jgi:hypothetical protein